MSRQFLEVGRKARKPLKKKTSHQNSEAKTVSLGKEYTGMGIGFPVLVLLSCGCEVSTAYLTARRNIYNERTNRTIMLMSQPHDFSKISMIQSLYLVGRHTSIGP